MKRIELISELTKLEKELLKEGKKLEASKISEATSVVFTKSAKDKEEDDKRALEAAADK